MCSSFSIHKYENIRMFCLKNFIFFMVKFSVYLNRHVFVMLGILWEAKDQQFRNTDNKDSDQTMRRLI